MKSIVSLRFLCVLSFLLLISPFYDSCNGHGMNKVEEKAVKAPAVNQYSENVSENKLEIINNSIGEVEKPEKNFLETIEDFIDDGDSQNAYEIGAMSWIIFTCGFECQINGLKSSIKDNDFKELFYGLTNISFVFIVIFTFAQLIVCFTKKTKLLNKLSFLILIFLAIAIICIPFDGLFKEITQIKWGFYCFIVVNGLIFYFSKRFLEKQLP